MSLCNFFLPRLKMEAGGGLMTVLGAIISGHKNKWRYEWKSFATILSNCPRHRLGSETQLRETEPWIVKSFILKSLASQIDIWFW